MGVIVSYLRKQVVQPNQIASVTRAITDIHITTGRHIRPMPLAI